MKSTAGNQPTVVADAALTALTKMSESKFQNDDLNFILHSVNVVNLLLYTNGLKGDSSVFHKALRGHARRTDCRRNFVALYDVFKSQLGIFRGNFCRLLESRRRALRIWGRAHSSRSHAEARLARRHYEVYNFILQ